jgi:uncharacterized damage-inducible protein DinB
MTSQERKFSMSELTADQAYALVQNLLLGVIKNESKTTKRVLEAVPADKPDYRPDPHAKSAIELVRHIAAADIRFLDTVINGAFDSSPVLPENLKTPQDVAGWYENAFAERFAALTTLTGEQLTKIVDFRGIAQRPAYAFIQAGLLHTIHHRGQLSTYLRPAGGSVPAIYGESYDSAQAKKQAVPA